MNVAFRVDANATIGTGHLVRCMSLANELVRFGADCRFIARSLSPHLEAALRQAGHRLDLLPRPARPGAVPQGLAHAAWLEVPQETDAELTSALLGDDVVDWMVVDHYGIDARWIDLLRGKVRRFAAIDDLADRALPVDILVDQNFHPAQPSRYRDLVAAHTLQLLGPRFSLLRPEFRRADKKGPVHPGKTSKVFVCLGGAAPKAVVSDVVSALPKASIDAPVTLVAPGFAPADLAAARASVDVRLLGHVDNMASLLLEHDIAVGSGGGMLWERLCLGIPSIVLGYASNQEPGIESLLEAGLVRGLKSLSGVSGDQLREVIEQALGDSEWQASASSNGKLLVDGFGAVRVAAAILGSELRLRPADDSDAQTVWPWRNDWRTRRHFSNPAPLQLQEHLDWWHQAICDEKRALFVGAIGSIPVGVVRFDFKDRQAVISIYTDPDLAGSRIGSHLLELGLEAVSMRDEPPNSALAEIHPDNLASRALFKAAGFEPCGTNLFRLDLP